MNKKTIRGKLTQIIKIVKVYLGFPHVWITIIIAILSAVLLMLAVIYNNKNNLLFSVFINMFSGFVTGLIICLVATAKSMWSYKTESIIEWIENTHSKCLDFINQHRELLISKKHIIDDDYYNEIYELICLGNQIYSDITQSSFNKSLPFDPYEYCKKVFDIDAVEVVKSNQDIRDKIIYEFDSLSESEIYEVIHPMEHKIFIFNGDLIKLKSSLMMKMKYIRTSII